MSANVVKGLDLKKHSSQLQRIGLKFSANSLELMVVEMEMVAEVVGGRLKVLEDH